LLAQIQLYFSNLAYFQKETDVLQLLVDEEFNSLKIANSIHEIYKELI